MKYRQIEVHKIDAIDNTNQKKDETDCRRWMQNEVSKRRNLGTLLNTACVEMKVN